MEENLDWQFSVEHGRSGFDRLRARWQALVDGWQDASYVQQPAWIGCHMDGLPDGGSEIHFITAERGGRLGGVLALEYRQGGIHALMPQLMLVCGEHLIQADLVADRASLDLWPAMMGWLERQRGLRCMALRLPIVGADSALHQAVTLDQGRPTQRAVRGNTAWLDCSHDAEFALREVSRGFRQNLNRLSRRAAQSGELVYQLADTPAALEGALEDFFKVEASGWKKDTGTAILQDPALVRFYRSLVRDYGPRGTCRINVLRLDGQAIAAQFGLISGRTLHLLKIGYSAEHASLAPGNLIMRETISRVCADPALDRLSFVTHPTWAHHWKPHLTPIEYVTVFPDTLFGRALRNALAWRRRQIAARLAEQAPAPLTQLPVTDFAPDALTMPIPLADPVPESRRSRSAMAGT